MIKYLNFEDINPSSPMYNQTKTILSSEEEHRESFLGGHFIETYQKCPWLFFLKYVLGFQANSSKRYFIRGQAIHSAIEYYLTSNQTIDDIQITQHIPTIYIDMHMNDYKDEDIYLSDRELVFHMIYEWLYEYLSFNPDIDKYETIEIEKQHIITLENGFPLTVRVDRLVRSKETGRLIVIDTKTTKNSPAKTINSFRLGNQGLMYLYAINQVYNEKPAGVIVDVLVGSALKYSFKAEPFRSSLITYKDYDFVQWEMNIIGVLSEITQKVKTYYEGQLPPEFLFPRNPSNCSFMGCPYSDICRQPHQPNKLPPGYTRDSWVDEKLLENISTNRSYIERLLYNLTVNKEVLNDA